ncbi:hypothetical protein V8Z80_00110 [Orrella sp. JC864]|uniref:hypothetical protein n=1 Tax=Orrella sp. JC864 TaxID=3120298 RepID=UPI00300A4073
MAHSEKTYIVLERGPAATSAVVVVFADDSTDASLGLLFAAHDSGIRNGFPCLPALAWRWRGLRLETF